MTESREQSENRIAMTILFIGFYGDGLFELWTWASELPAVTSISELLLSSEGMMTGSSDDDIRGENSTTNVLCLKWTADQNETRQSPSCNKQVLVPKAINNFSTATSRLRPANHHYSALHEQTTTAGLGKINAKPFNWCNNGCKWPGITNCKYWCISVSSLIHVFKSDH